MSKSTTLVQDVTAIDAGVLGKPNRRASARRGEGDDYYVGGVRSKERVSRGGDDMQSRALAAPKRKSKVRRGWRKCLEYRSEGYPVVAREHLVKSFLSLSIPPKPKKGTTWGWRETNQLAREAQRRRARALWLGNMAKRLERVEELGAYMSEMSIKETLGAAQRYVGVHDEGYAAALMLAQGEATRALALAGEAQRAWLLFCSESWAAKIHRTSPSRAQDVAQNFTSSVLEGIRATQRLAATHKDALMREQHAAIEGFFERLDLSPLHVHVDPSLRASLETMVAGIQAWRGLEAPVPTKEGIYAIIHQDAMQTQMSVRQLAERHHVGRRTVTLALASPYPLQHQRPALGAFLSIISSKLDADPQMTAADIWRELTSAHGATVSQSHVRNFVAQYRASQTSGLPLEL